MFWDFVKALLFVEIGLPILFGLGVLILFIIIKALSYNPELTWKVLKWIAYVIIGVLCLPILSEMISNTDWDKLAKELEWFGLFILMMVPIFLFSLILFIISTAINRSRERRGVVPRFTYKQKLVFHMVFWPLATGLILLLLVLIFGKY